MISLFRVYFYMIVFQVCVPYQRLTFAWMTLGITIQFSITLFQCERNRKYIHPTSFINIF
jgi:hypothetical protein